jgi:hypothetical protein
MLADERSQAACFLIDHSSHVGAPNWFKDLPARRTGARSIYPELWNNRLLMNRTRTRFPRETFHYNKGGTAPCSRGDTASFATPIVSFCSAIRLIIPGSTESQDTVNPVGSQPGEFCWAEGQHSHSKASAKSVRSDLNAAILRARPQSGRANRGGVQENGPLRFRKIPVGPNRSGTRPRGG